MFILRKYYMSFFSAFNFNYKNITLFLTYVLYKSLAIENKLKKGNNFVFKTENKK